MDIIDRTITGIPARLTRDGITVDLDGLNAYDRDVAELGHEAAYAFAQDRVRHAQGRR